MRINRTLTREDDSQNCYVFKNTPTLAHGVIIKVWVPRRLVGEAPEHINAIIDVGD